MIQKGACLARSVSHSAIFLMSNWVPHPCPCSLLSSAGVTITLWCWGNERCTYSLQEMEKIADCVIIINIIKVSFTWIKVAKNCWRIFWQIYHSPETKEKKNSYNFDQLFNKVEEMSLHEEISQGKIFLQPHSLPNNPPSISLSFFSEQQSELQRTTAVEITPTELSLLIYDIRLVIYWLIMAGRWEQVRVYLPRKLGKSWIKRWRGRTAVWLVL